MVPKLKLALGGGPNVVMDGFVVKDEAGTIAEEEYRDCAGLLLLLSTGDKGDRPNDEVVVAIPNNGPCPKLLPPLKPLLPLFDVKVPKPAEVPVVERFFNNGLSRLDFPEEDDDDDDGGMGDLLPLLMPKPELLLLLLALKPPNVLLVLPSPDVDLVAELKENCAGMFGVPENVAIVEIVTGSSGGEIG
jgi:hypothetical protein